MKFKYMIIICVFFLLIGTVSAGENTTDAINVTVPEKIYHENLGDIEVDLPQNTTGSLKALVDDVEIYNENVTSEHVRIPISIQEPKQPYVVPNRPIDYTLHSYSVFLNDISIKSDSFMVMRFNQTHDYFSAIPEEILKDDDIRPVSLLFPSSANGTVEMYIDGEFKEKLNTTTYLFLNSTMFSSLEIGNHSARIIYSGDDYYLPSDRSYNFTLTDMVIVIPHNVVLDHDDCVSARINHDTDGKISVYVDGKLIDKSSLDDGEYILTLFDYVSCGKHEIEVTYVAKNYSKTKKQTVNVSYYVDIDLFGTAYGDENSLIIIVPHDLNAKFASLSIDGAEYGFKMDDSGWIEIDVSKLSAGNHTAVFDFKGDGKYFQTTSVYEFAINYIIKTPDWYIVDEGYQTVSLTLPGDAKGSLEVLIDGVLYKSVKLSKGKASIAISGLECGIYDLTAQYVGDDYSVKTAESYFVVYPSVSSPYEMKYSENRFITVTVSNHTGGSVKFISNGKEYDVKVIDGKAVLSLKSFKVGEYEFDIIYTDEDGANHTAFAFVEIKDNYQITKAKDIKTDYNKKTKYSVKILKNSKILKNAKVTFKINSKTVTVKTDKNGIVTFTLPKLKPGKYKLTVSCSGVKVSKKITVRHIITLKTVKVKKSSKLVLVAKTKKSLKGKTITFKFSSKKYKAKVNSKGIAKVNVPKSVLKKLKVGRTVKYQAVYLKDCVVKSAKVKR